MGGLGLTEMPMIVPRVIALRVIALRVVALRVVALRLIAMSSGRVGPPKWAAPFFAMGPWVRIIFDLTGPVSDQT